MTITPAVFADLIELLEAMRRADLPPPTERRRIRESAGLSQRGFALAMGVGERNVCNWEDPDGSEPTLAHRLIYRMALDLLQDRTLATTGRLAEK
jgi:DNA-binding transcriptional regulator YiaG